MKKRTNLLKAAAVSMAMLMLAACGGDTSSTPNQGGDTPNSTPASTPAEGDNTADDDIGFVKGQTLFLVIPGSSGGGSDLGIRYYGAAIQQEYGITTTFENYNNTVGHQMVADAKPDGLTLMIATGALNIQYLMGQADVDPINDLTLIACLQDNGFGALAIPANAPYDDLDGFVAYAKDHPGELNVGVPASGTNVLQFEMLQKRLGIELNPVTCANESERLTNLAGGFIDIGIVGVGNAQEHEAAGNLKVIGTLASNGITIDMYPEELPERYKTLQEQGYDDLYLNVFHYLYGPAGMDETMVANMNAAMEHIVDVVAADIDNIGNVHGWHNLEESYQIRDQEFNDMKELIKGMGDLRPDLQ